MSDVDALHALIAADPISKQGPAQDDELLLRNILSSPRGPHRRRRNRRLLVALVAVAGILAVAGFTVATKWVGQSSLPGLLRSARAGIPLPAGVAWSDADVPLLVSDERVDQSTFPRSQALVEAQCRWERAWSDALASGDAAAAAAAGTGLTAIRGLWVDLYPLDASPSYANGGGALAQLDPVIAAARRGEAGPLAAQLALCPSWLGGTWTPQGDIEQALRHQAEPALAVVLPLASRVGTIDDERRWHDVIKRLDRPGLRAAGGFSGGGVAVAYVTGDDLPALITATRNALASADLPAGSALRTWDPAGGTLGSAPISG